MGESSASKAHIQKSLAVWKPELERYTGLVQQIKEKSKEHKALVKLRLDATFFTDKRNRHNTISEVGHVRTLADLISLIYFYHTIAHTNMCLDVLRGLLCWLQLFPQCCHKYPQGSHIVIPTAAPDILCDKGMGQYLADILG